jgi:DNA polymerase-3 subunit epsilon
MDFGVILDVETTGLDPATDKIIEIGLLEFAVEGEDEPCVTRSYGALNDPGIPLSEEVTRITGIKQAHVTGQRIDWNIVRDFLCRASIVIAHNAEFDKAFVLGSKELEGLKLHWGCSMRHVDWRKHRFNSLSLNYLAADHGFVNPFAHRALFDCATTFRLVKPYLNELIIRSYEREYVLKAVNSPFESKDVLRARGYRWDPEERVWGRVVTESELKAEQEFLAAEVYKGRGEPLALERAGL